MTGKSELEAAWPLSPLQEGFLFHALYHDRAWDVYTIQYIIDLSGPLNSARLRTAAQAVLDRHSCLRVAFVPANDPPVQIVVREVAVSWTEIDLSDRTTGDWPRQFDELAKKDRVTRFDLQTPPLLRFLLVKIGEEHHRLMLSVHHILLDGWSLRLVATELFTLYTSNGDSTELPPARSYQDYLVWLSTRDRAAASAAWKHALAGLEEPTLLTAAAPARPPMLPSQVSVDVSENLTSRLTSLARARGLTMSTLMQVAWAMVLSCSTGRWDVVFGAAVFGRPAELGGFESMIGMFVNTVPVRVRLDPAESLTDLLNRIQVEQVQLFDHQYMGLAELQRSVGLGDLFDTLMTFHFPLSPHMILTRALNGTGITVTGMNGFGSTHYPISLVAAPGTSLNIVLKYRPDVLDLFSVRILTDRLVRALEVMAGDPGARLSAVDILSAQQRRQILVEWNDTAAHTENSTVPEMFITQMARTPEAIAVVHGDQSVTYAELGERVDRLAHRLIACGAGPEHIVGVCLERSVDLVVTLLGVLRAGAAFVALDPEWPVARIAQVCRSAKVMLTVTTAAMAEMCPPDSVRVTVEDPLPLALAVSEPVRSGNSGVPLHSENLAYVIFTSGSTGTPKGVMIRHGAIASRLSWQRELLNFGAQDAVLFKAPMGFDISINEIFLPLVSGARLVVAQPGGERDTEYLLNVIEHERVTFTYLVSSMLDLMLELPEVTARARELKHVWCGGEALSLELFERFQARLDAVMYHGYGPAEATIGVTHQSYRPGQSRDGVTIGRPNPNTRIYLLDQALRPVPPGVVGELYTGGLPLGRGYVNDPAQTAARFVADPFTSSQRLYRTGDLARWRPDGVLEFHGRADSQIKIRGMRVETREIEAVLTRHPQVAQAVVIAYKDSVATPGVIRLIGYIVAREIARQAQGDNTYNTSDSTDIPAATHQAVTLLQQLREALEQQLPKYMIPARMILLDQLPLTANGKINTTALLNLESTAQMNTEEKTAITENGDGVTTESGLREDIVEIWQRVLAKTRISVHDNFFDLGGDSILLLKVRTLLADRLSREISLVDLYSYPTVASLAAHFGVTTEKSGELDQSAARARQQRRARRGRTVESPRREASHRA